MCLLFAHWIGGGEKEVREGTVQVKIVIFRRYFRL